MFVDKTCLKFEMSAGGYGPNGGNGNGNGNGPDGEFSLNTTQERSKGRDSNSRKLKDAPL